MLELKHVIFKLALARNGSLRSFLDQVKINMNTRNILNKTADLKHNFMEHGPLTVAITKT